MTTQRKVWLVAYKNDAQLLASDFRDNAVESIESFYLREEDVWISCMTFPGRQYARQMASLISPSIVEEGSLWMEKRSNELTTAEESDSIIVDKDQFKWPTESNAAGYMSKYFKGKDPVFFVPYDSQSVKRRRDDVAGGGDGGGATPEIESLAGGVSTSRGMDQRNLIKRLIAAPIQELPNHVFSFSS